MKVETGVPIPAERARPRFKTWTRRKPLPEPPPMTGWYANVYRERDTIPYEVVRFIGVRKIELREMICDLKKGWRPEMFLGRCVNNDSQEWSIGRDLRAPIFSIRRLKNGTWRDDQDNIFVIERVPIRWHLYDGAGGMY